MKPLNKNILTLKKSMIRVFNQKAKATPGAISLTLGEPDFDTPDLIKAEAKTSLDQNKTHYIQNNGSDDLLHAIADFEKKRNPFGFGPDEIIVTSGATEALFVALFGILNPGDEVIVLTPAFSLYEEIIKMCGAKFVSLNTTENEFQVTEKMLDLALSENTKAVIINSPNNPTGCVLNESSIKAIHDFIKKNDLYLISDDVYDRICYLKALPQIYSFSDVRDRVIAINSFSKPYAMTGWRMGYLMTNKELKEKLQLIHQFCVVSTVSFNQEACKRAFDTDISQMVNIYKSRRDFLTGQLKRLDIDFFMPQGAFYVFISIKQFGQDSLTFCENLLEKQKLALTPGIAFGEDNNVRISYATSMENLSLGINRLEKFVKTF